MGLAGRIGACMPQELTVGRASRAGTDFLWVLFASGPRCGFASPETTELRGAAMSGSADGRSHPSVCGLVGLVCL